MHHRASQRKPLWTGLNGAVLGTPPMPPSACVVLYCTNPYISLGRKARADYTGKVPGSGASSVPVPVPALLCNLPARANQPELGLLLKQNMYRRLTALSEQNGYGYRTRDTKLALDRTLLTDALALALVLSTRLALALAFALARTEPIDTLYCAWGTVNEIRTRSRTQEHEQSL